MTLTGRQKRHLRGLGHHLDPVVIVGEAGVSDALVAKTDAELEAHELIKVRILGGGADGVGTALAARTGAALAQVLGKTALLYRRRRTEPEIVLPR